MDISIRYYLERIKELGVYEAVNKLYYIMKNKFKKIFVPIESYFAKSCLSDDDLLKLVKYFSLEELLSSLRKARGVKLIVSKNEIDFIRDYYTEKNLLEKKINQADEICSHVFSLLGSGKVKLDPIDWHLDFKSSYRWNPKKYFKLIEPGPKIGVDIKVPWELSRCQHFVVLGQAYWLTGNNKYAQEILNEIEDWIRQNPYPYGVNWRCPMEAGIRAVNWIVGVYFLCDSLYLSDDFLIKLVKSIYQHATHIINNLEKCQEHTNNHYLADIVGLLFISVAFPQFKDADEWKKFAVQEMIAEMQKQVNSDGTDFEGSTAYHRLALEMFFYGYLLCSRNNIVMPENFVHQLWNMFKVTLNIIKPNGNIPQIGDNDNGRFIKFSEGNILDHTYLLGIASILFSDSQFKVDSLEDLEDAVWLFGRKGLDEYKSLELQKYPCIPISFDTGGWYVLKNDEAYLFVVCNKNNGGHFHNDKLSFEMNIKGLDFFVDCGTYSYTSEPQEGNIFRNTRSHNTIVYAKSEQNVIFYSNKAVLFLKDKTNAICLAFAKDYFLGEHFGYGFKHQREMILKDNECIINDLVENYPQCRFVLNLHPDVRVVRIDENRVSLQNGNVKVIVLSLGDGKIALKGSFYSPEYGRKIKTKQICIPLAKKLNEVKITW